MNVDEATTGRDRFHDLVSRQSRFVFRVAYSILRNVQDSEDVVQETFLKLYRTGAWERMSDERAYLARMAWRIAVERRRTAQLDDPDVDIACGGANPEQAAMTANWNATIHRLIDALPEELRQPLALSAVEEMSSREIGKVMEIPEGTVRTRLMRARGILKQKLAALLAGTRDK
ncbi:MAG: sigma-70 family RNA polymerase sigma factor [Bryobacteraceae bacterium]